MNDNMGDNMSDNMGDISLDCGKILLGDCLDRMSEMEDDSVDAIITDPPYGLSFVGAEWDTFGSKSGTYSAEVRRAKSKTYADEHKGAPRYGNSHGKGSMNKTEALNFQLAMTPIFEEALRVAKLGAHLLCFGGTRTFHHTSCAIEDAGWEIRDCLMWVYGTGMPHGQNIGKLMAKKHLSEAERFFGWNTQLKPAWEPIIMARKPIKGSVISNMVEYGTGGLNIDACRVEYKSEDDKSSAKPFGKSTSKGSGHLAGGGDFAKSRSEFESEQSEVGRFPANLVHDGSDEVIGIFPDSKGQLGSITGNEPSKTNEHGIYGLYSGKRPPKSPRGDSGSAARFFYCAKATRKERGDFNHHPTVKPISLMEWLVKMVTTENAVVLDPFSGSGSTLIAASNLNRRVIGIEKNPEYVEIISKRFSQ